MEKLEIIEKHKKYLAPCVTHYYKEPSSWIGERESMSTISMGESISTFLEGFSPSAWVTVMMKSLPDL